VVTVHELTYTTEADARAAHRELIARGIWASRIEHDHRRALYLIHSPVGPIALAREYGIDTGSGAVASSSVVVAGAMLRRRSDGRCEVADTAAANARYGCPVDDWCILAAGHIGGCCEGREVWPGPDALYATSKELGGHDGR
jgi:hypothetical protein